MPPLTIQDYNPHGLALMLVYKHGSTHAGLGGYAWPELSWLGLVAIALVGARARRMGGTGAR